MLCCLSYLWPASGNDACNSLLLVTLPEKVRLRDIANPSSSSMTRSPKAYQVVRHHASQGVPQRQPTCHLLKVPDCHKPASFLPFSIQLSKQTFVPSTQSTSSAAYTYTTHHVSIHSPQPSPPSPQRTALRDLRPPLPPGTQAESDCAPTRATNHLHRPKSPTNRAIYDMSFPLRRDPRLLLFKSHLGFLPTRQPVHFRQPDRTNCPPRHPERKQDLHMCILECPKRWGCD